MNNAVDQINRYPADSLVSVLLTLIRQLAIYPVDSVIQPLNIRALFLYTGIRVTEDHTSNISGLNNLLFHDCS